MTATTATATAASWWRMLIDVTRVLMLDFDGVLNSSAFWHAKQVAGEKIRSRDLDRQAVANLNRILEVSDASVVVSSTWRLFYTRRALQRILNDHGFKGRIHDITPDLSVLGGEYVERGHEIQAWMAQHNVSAEAVVIVDDNSDMAHLRPRLVQTDPRFGLTGLDVAEALAPWGIPA